MDGPAPPATRCLTAGARPLQSPCSVCICWECTCVTGNYISQAPLLCCLVSGKIQPMGSPDGDQKAGEREKPGCFSFSPSASRGVSGGGFVFSKALTPTRRPPSMILASSGKLQFPVTAFPCPAAPK